MKTLLIPVDFTPATRNALKFAAGWSQKYDYERIILLKSVYTSMYENVIMSGEFANVDEEYLNHNRSAQKEKLDELCKSLAAMITKEIKVHTALTELPLTRGILELVKQEKPVMILIGSDQANNQETGFISGNVITIAKISPVRVMVVPSTYKYQEIKQALVPCDFNAIDSLNKINTLHASIKWKDVNLLVLNVDPKERHLHPDEKFRKAENNLRNYLQNFKHEIFFVADQNVIHGILRFSKTHDVQMLIALPGEYSFLYALTHKSVSQALYLNSQLPVMILK
jgi:nucleotide-binding universal stress UspA family protein